MIEEFSCWIEKPWGNYFVLFYSEHCKVKVLVVKPHCKLSFQKHMKRNELWFVEKGTPEIKTKNKIKQLREHDIINIGKKHWHQLINNTENEIRIIEIQYGEKCVEDDICRKEIISKQ
jgi:mannose-6-phosphate isomerase-like protein (cupin superfamily)